MKTVKSLVTGTQFEESFGQNRLLSKSALVGIAIAFMVIVTQAYVWYVHHRNMESIHKIEASWSR